MTIEEFNAFIATEEGKKWLEAAPANEIGTYISPNSTRFNELVEEAKGPLLKKKTELENEAKTAKEKRRDLESQMESTTKYLHLLEDFSIGLDDDGKLSYSKVEEVLRNIRAGKDDPAAGANPSELAEVQRRLKKSQRDMDKQLALIGTKDEELKRHKADIEVRDTFIQNLLITEDMRAALSKLGYPAITVDNLLPSLVAKSGAQVNYDESIEDINKKWSAITDDGRPISEWAKYWSTTEEGAFFMPGRQNSGGGAGGSGGTGSAKAWKDMSPEEKAALYRKDPALYRQARDGAKG